MLRIAAFLAATLDWKQPAVANLETADVQAATPAGNFGGISVTHLALTVLGSETQEIFYRPPVSNSAGNPGFFRAEMTRPHAATIERQQLNLSVLKRPIKHQSRSAESNGKRTYEPPVESHQKPGCRF